ncbi:Ferritin Dps family protein [Pseudopedobacter saltans DSM 12145]|uniref:Ferritin Dps family protein n=1 Tax=Pseudopedobacter saltans (strain ATCC 51119 / DSM 12145 / JCM 21818 / CCUG 39354 / LMG 10337 / NBRC 100064 / NCIMB 13643) TaxID=762903 RepID=F0S5S2_PSESL|nr:DNA starvation/stationary phase protection protein [Pseudopedobacter saltans]ADY50993.1 Ferritin Dps family protein [Pseudopedobacter saltans DSM 12145]
MATNKIGLNDKEVVELVDLLNDLLANYQIHYQKLRGCHWNVRGNDFFTLHLKFEELYNNAQLTIDELAERVLTLGKSPHSTYANYIKVSKIKEINTEGLAPNKMVDAILEDYKVLLDLEREIIETASENVNDEGTADMITGFVKFQEKTSWMLRAYNGNK